MYSSRGIREKEHNICQLSCKVYPFYANIYNELGTKEDLVCYRLETAKSGVNSEIYFWKQKN